MARSASLLLLLGLALGAVMAEASSSKRDRPDRCPQCQPSECPALVPSSCLFGTTLDRCGCCHVCAQMEGEQCDMPDQPYRHGPCGEELQCTRTEEGNYCLCQKNEIICGSDGVRYSDMCKLVAARTRTGLGNKLTVKSRGPCDPAAEIVTAPESSRNYTGGHVVLSCEAIGLPTPFIAWLFTDARNNTITLPGDQENMLIATRGGPGKYQVTGWLQVENLQKEQEGDYTCVAKNKHATVHAPARVLVVDPTRR